MSHHLLQNLLVHKFCCIDDVFWRYLIVVKGGDHMIHRTKMAHIGEKLHYKRILVPIRQICKVCEGKNWIEYNKLLKAYVNYKNI